MTRKKGTGTLYRIVVRSELSDTYAVAFEGMQMETKDGDTSLTGEIVDQPQLYGILNRINSLGLELLSVQVLPEYAHLSAERETESQSHESREAARGPAGPIHPTSCKVYSPKLM